MFLEVILAHKREEILRKMMELPQAALEDMAAFMPAPRDFTSAITTPGLAVIAEVKRRSPSRGPLGSHIDAARLSLLYEAGGAAAISVLTDSRHFGARERDLEAVRTSVGLPILRKDFIVSEYQVWQTRAMGADAVLLIAAALQQAELARLVSLASSLGLCPLVEVHSEGEVNAALEAGARVVGINNRDLGSFGVDLETTRRLAEMVPEEVAVVSESGISSPDQAASMRSWGADAILVGEALVASSDPAGLIRSLRKAGAAAASRRHPLPGNDRHPVPDRRRRGP